MERITSFSVDHTKLNKGIYISRVDDDLITTDIRMTTPNIDIPLDPKAAHTIEHIGATLLRNGKYKENIIIQKVVNSTFGIPIRTTLHTSMTATIIPTRATSFADNFHFVFSISLFCK